MGDYCIILRKKTAKAGGISVYAMNLARRLGKVKFSPQEKVSYFFWQFIVIPLWLIKSNCEVYHPAGLIEGVVLPILKPRAKKYITVHDLIPLKRKRSGIPGIIERAVVRLALLSVRMYDRIYAVSHLTKIDLVRRGIPEDKIKVIYQGIDEKFLSPVKGKSGETFNVGYISRMEGYKRHELLFDLFLDYRNPNARLYLGGSGELFDRIKEKAAKDMRVRVLGFVPDDKIVEFYDNLDVYVHPSKYEGWGLPIIEAMARGKPVIVFEDSEIPREVRGRCIVIRPSNLPRVLEELEKNRKLLRKLSIRARRLAMIILKKGRLPPKA
ncbi:glycosyl transferase [Thermococcus chitonophagus]|uniref:Glycosyl transferase n=2 Tax=Thermococcus chitonophagus TaxID=54262 RepID=A0A160VR66_9EURY|nr:glycosyl transferase [Thermococcus chitonophagus]CUX77292.1 Glycosyltransferase [Thermococcus chitonophagus]